MTSTITDIKQQVRRNDRYSIYIDGKYVLSLHEATLLNLRLKKGMPVTEDELRQLSDQSRVDKGYERALNLISYRPRSEWEVRDYLRRKDYEPEIADRIVQRLYERSYLDDADFARRWIDSRRRLKATSFRRLTQELRQKRIADEVIEQAMAADETSELAVLRELVERKKLQSKYQDEQKLMQYLSRQGFGYGDIKTALSNDQDRD